MGQAPWKSRATNAMNKATKLHQQDEAPETRAARIDRLQAKISAGTYRISAEALSAKLLRRIQWW